MTRSRIVVDLSTGEQSVVPYTLEEEAEADAAYEADQARKSAATAEANGAALDERQKKTAKDEAAALAKSGDYKAAILKLVEIYDS